MANDLYVIIGAYGSGKSEYAIHLARSLKNSGKDVVLADMDVVNPYFRSRDVRDEFADYGIDVIAPEGEFSHADLPMISPRIMGAIENYSKTVILDVGGDPAGCRTLARFTEAIIKRGYQMQFVVNTKRPFTSNPEEIIAMMGSLQAVSKLPITEIICNTNLMEYTDAQIVEEGIGIILMVSEQLEIDFKTYLVLDAYNELIPEHIEGKHKETMTYTLKKPWEANSHPAMKC